MPLPHPLVVGPDNSLWAPNLLFPWRQGRPWSLVASGTPPTIGVVPGPSLRPEPWGEGQESRKVVPRGMSSHLACQPQVRALCHDWCSRPVCGGGGLGTPGGHTLWRPLPQKRGFLTPVDSAPLCQ